MTVDDRRRISALELARALHPAGWGRLREPPPEQRTGRGTAGGGRPTESAPATLWPEDVCRARLRTATQGQLTLAGRRSRLPVTVAAVDGDEVLLVTPPAWPLGGPAAAVAARLDLGGVTSELQRWVVRVHGLLQVVVPDDPSDPAELAVLALTVERVRGFGRARAS